LKLQHDLEEAQKVGVTKIMKTKFSDIKLVLNVEEAFLIK